VTVHVLAELDGARYEVCDHEGAAVTIADPGIEGVRCTECGCAWWRTDAVPGLPDPQWLAPFPRLVAITEAPCG
jgi:hypothetical protein